MCLSSLTVSLAMCLQIQTHAKEAFLLKIRTRQNFQDKYSGDSNQSNKKRERNEKHKIWKVRRNILSTEKIKEINYYKL